MINRSAIKEIEKWFNKSGRKPLVIRGARQVGKSTLVRQVAEELHVPLWEVNLEKHSGLNSVFASLNIPEIIQEISLKINVKGIGKGPGILFFDEIQASPQALTGLRYFHEERPDIALISAGSLLEFTLAEKGFSMPVGRIEYFWLGPLNFLEFLSAMGESLLYDTLTGYTAENIFPQSAHERLLRLLREFLIIGGMPEAVQRYQETKDFIDAVEVHRSIIETYKDDFSKYTQGSDLEKLRRVYEVLPSLIGEKTRFRHFHPDWKSSDIRRCLEMLQRAGIAQGVTHSDGNALPLGAAEDPTVMKLFHLDIGLVGTATGTGMITLEDFLMGRFINKGPRAEQFAAQHLSRLTPPSQRPELHYWLREGKSHNAEVDFLVPNQSKVLPIEIKSGISGTLRSLHQFMTHHEHALAVRFDLNLPSDQKIQTEVMTPKGKTKVNYTLRSLPLYMVPILKQLAN